jgi:hypothetical protein
MSTWGSYSFLAGPLMAFAALAGLLLVARWMAGGRASLIERPSRPGAAEEYGLMIPVASPRSDREGAHVAAQLAAAGVRARLVRTTEGPRVMVWSEDVARARSVLDSPTR